MGTLSQWWMLAEAIVRYGRLRRHVNAPSDSCIGNKANQLPPAKRVV